MFDSMFDWLNFHVGALIVTGTLFGGMVFFAFLFTPLVFRYTEREDAAQFLRRVFPVYDRAMGIVAVIPAVLLIPAGTYSIEIYLMLVVAAAFIGVARFLLPIVDRTREAGETAKFSRLHRLSVFIHSAQMIAVAVVFVRLAQ